ncbi:MAG: TIGR02281 family clan AA aspartic protease [Candidatus Thiodiazotropha sp.]
MSLSQQPESPKQGDDSRRFGRWMIVATWLLLLILLTLLFSNWLQRERNPNRALSVADAPAGGAVTLRSNREGHYLAPGEINGVEVTFLLDTGATWVAVPEGEAERAGLRKGPKSQSLTAGGVTDTWLTRIDSLRLGPFEMQGVRAAIIPDMPGDEVLLGVNFLKHFTLEQTGDRMRITLPE